jgi:hypothetical protein
VQKEVQEETQTLTEGDNSKPKTSYEILLKHEVPGIISYGIEYEYYGEEAMFVADDSRYRILKMGVGTSEIRELIEEQFIEPGVATVHGLACDHQGNLYYSIYYGSRIVKYNLHNRTTVSYRSPVVWEHGIDYGRGYLWIHEHNGNMNKYYIYRCDPDNLFNYKRFITPHNRKGGSGITLAEPGYMWYCNSLTKMYYKIQLDNALENGDCDHGAIVDSFSCELVGRLTWDNTAIWVMYNDNTFYRIKPVTK